MLQLKLIIQLVPSRSQDPTNLKCIRYATNFSVSFNSNICTLTITFSESDLFYWTTQVSGITVEAYGMLKLENAYVTLYPAEACVVEDHSLGKGNVKTNVITHQFGQHHGNHRQCYLTVNVYRCVDTSCGIMTNRMLKSKCRLVRVLP